MIGNALEWYDFVIYGFFTPILGKHFFPHFDVIAQHLAVWGIFWSGFFIRPLGGLFFGYLGDKYSRKQALVYSIFIMVIPTMLIGFLPGYETLGIMAPAILVMLRLMQGFAMGGEFTGTIIFLVEHAPPKKHCSYGSYATFSVVIGVIVGSLTTLLFTNLMDEETLNQWGWRIPFIISILGGLIGGYIRMHLYDPNVFTKLIEIKDQSHMPNRPLRNLVVKYKSSLLMILSIDFLTAIGFYIFSIFLPTYFSTYFNFKTSDIFIINTINMLIFSIFILLGGRLGDIWGRKKVLAISCGLIIIFVYPLFLMIHEGSYASVAIMQGLFAIIYGLYQGVFPTTIAEIMPISVRYSGVSLAHNISMACFGGSTPFIATELIKITGIITAPAFMLIFAGVLSAIGIYYLKE